MSASPPWEEIAVTPHFCRAFHFGTLSTNANPVLVPSQISGDDDVSKTVFAMHVAMQKMAAEHSKTVEELSNRVTVMHETMEFQNKTIKLLEAECSSLRLQQKATGTAATGTQHVHITTTPQESKRTSPKAPAFTKRQQMNITPRTSAERMYGLTSTGSAVVYDSPPSDFELRSTSSDDGSQGVGGHPRRSSAATAATSAKAAAGESSRRSLTWSVNGGPAERPTSASSYTRHVVDGGLLQKKPASLSAYYRNKGSASYASGSPRFGSGVELAMRGVARGTNASLAEEQPNMPCIGMYSAIHRDNKGTYWASSLKTSSAYMLPADPAAMATSGPFLLS